jgi:type II secretory pathway pseudopilin PulG
VSILAAALAPSFVGQLDKTARDQESATLRALGDALQKSIMRKRYVPGPANWDWATNIATELGVDTASVTTSPRQQPRFFLVDPALQIGTNVAGQAYRQSTEGAAGVVSPRVMLVSSIGRALPNGIVTGVPSSTDFNAIWNWNDASNSVPGTTFSWTGWTASDDLRVQRVDLSPLFVRLLLSTWASSVPPYYSIDQSAPVQLTPSKFSYFSSNSVSFIENSVIGLYNGSGLIDSQQILIQNSAFLYYLDSWRGSVSGAPLIAGLDIAAVVDQYMSAYPNARAQNGTNQQAIVVQSMIAFMDAYSAWAASGFPYTPAGGQSTAPAYVFDAEAAMRAALQGQYLQGQRCCDPVETPCQ